MVPVRKSARFSAFDHLPARHPFGQRHPEPQYAGSRRIHIFGGAASTAGSNHHLDIAVVAGSSSRTITSALVTPMRKLTSVPQVTARPRHDIHASRHRGAGGIR
jgi:hypothetical protein